MDSHHPLTFMHNKIDTSGISGKQYVKGLDYTFTPLRNILKTVKNVTTAKF